MSKLTTVAVGAVAYVLGARAGRERYEQIVANAQRLWGLESRRFPPFCSPIFPRDKYKVLRTYKIVRVASQTDWRVGARLP